MWVKSQSSQGSQSHYLQEILHVPVWVELLTSVLGINSAPDSVSKDWAEIFQLSATVSLRSVELKLTRVGSPFSGSLVNQHKILKPRGTAQPGFPKVFIPSEEEISPSLLHLALQKGSDGASPLPTPFLLLENPVLLPVDFLDADINLGHVVLWVVGDILDGSFHHWMWRRQEVVMEQQNSSGSSPNVITGEQLCCAVFTPITCPRTHFWAYSAPFAQGIATQAVLCPWNCA